MCREVVIPAEKSKDESEHVQFYFTGDWIIGPGSVQGPEKFRYGHAGTQTTELPEKPEPVILKMVENMAGKCGTIQIPADLPRRFFVSGHTEFWRNATEGIAMLTVRFQFGFFKIPFFRKYFSVCYIHQTTSISHLACSAANRSAKPAISPTSIASRISAIRSW